MREYIQKILTKITDSVTQGNPTSSVRVQSYIILLPILVMVVVFLVIEMWSFVHAIKNGLPYRLSNEIIVVFGMILSHHVGLLFSRSKSQSIAEIKGTETVNVDSTTDPSITDTNADPTINNDSGTTKAEM